ncbi:hypothetical protein KZ483_17895 [Paenibacillus sp. sptzw28]|uniref:hypothetical protein n=1 Tax=Paenibacillus sp. sptzw28 TaxID=715179 RepID=UPI001C6EB2B5|nr:hypothetical protein [Paenibacillus sp. sptzw28]QYR19747.1 hypothetical protein KZ483_17895 [Paenibacillus sp. sptzw28]
MPYRSIDLQMSIPRTQEKSTMQNQVLQKPIVDQTKLEADTARQTEQLRVKNSAVEQSGKPKIKERQRRESGSSFKRGKRGEATGESDDSSGEPTVPAVKKHPYKGQHIDISF